ncbi:hypothetical protein M0804_010945 [Polistes exclamans]|nr:hypothetical protein M0804_010945 [Polistes exclamans]
MIWFVCFQSTELQLFDKTTPSILTKNTETKLRKKLTTKERKKTNGGNNSNRRRVHLVGGYDSDSIGNEDDLGTTQIMAGSTSHEGGKTDRPLTLPSDSPSWIEINSASSRQGSIIRNTVFIFLILLRLMRNY